MRRGGAVQLLATGLLALWVPSRAPAQKTDVVTLINGDRITGKIMGVNRGKLSYDTEDAGLLSIEWVKVVGITSKRTFEVTDRSGRRHVGALRAATSRSVLAIGDNEADTLRIVDAVEMAELGARFAQRINGEANFGFTYTRANKSATLDGDVEVEYRAPNVGSSINYEIHQQKQEDAVPLSRWATIVRGSRYLKWPLWSLESVLAIEKNDELDLERRVFGGGGLGRTLRQSNYDNLEVIAGAVVAKEHFSVDSVADVTSTTVEGVLRAKAGLFRFDKPKLTVTTDLWAFKTLSSSRRVRGDAMFNIKYTSREDFTVGMEIRDIFDTKPPSEKARKNGLELTFTLGWKYRR